MLLQPTNNIRFSKVRALVELPFAFIKRQMKFVETKYLGLNKNRLTYETETYIWLYSEGSLNKS